MLDNDQDKATGKWNAVEAVEVNKETPIKTETPDTTYHMNTNFKIHSSKSKRRKKRKRAIPVTRAVKRDNNTLKFISAELTAQSTSTPSIPTHNSATMIIESSSNDDDGNDQYVIKKETTQQINELNSVTMIPQPSAPLLPSSVEEIDELASPSPPPPPPPPTPPPPMMEASPSNIETTTTTSILNTSPPLSVKEETKESVWISSSAEIMPSSPSIFVTDNIVTMKKAESSLPLCPTAYPPTNRLDYDDITPIKSSTEVSYSPQQQLLDSIDPALDSPDTYHAQSPSSSALYSPHSTLSSHPDLSTLACSPDLSSSSEPTTTTYPIESSAKPTTTTYPIESSAKPTTTEYSIESTSQSTNKLGKRRWNDETQSNGKLCSNGPISTYSSNNVFSFQHEGETCYCIGFEKDQTLVFIGYALIGALYGSIEISGATISANTDHPSRLKFSFDMSQYVSFYPVFSARTSGLTMVQSTCYEKVTTSAPSVTMNSTFDDLGQLLKRFEDRWETFQSIIIVKSLDWCGVAQLEQMVPSLNNIFGLTSKSAYVSNDGPFYDDIEGFQPIIDVTPEVKAIQHQPSWEIGVNRLTEYEQEHAVPSISIICGNKNVNKSAFARYTINRLLKNHYRVAYLETGIETTGLVALHVIDTPLLGPSFTHPHLKYKQCFFIGTTKTSQMDQDYYLQCIWQLLSRYRQESDEWTKIAYQDNDGGYFLPLVVNTHGWISGQGYDLLLKMIETIKPSHIFGLTAQSSIGFEGKFLASFAQEVMSILPLGLHINQQLMFLNAPMPTSELLVLPHHCQLMLLSYLYHDPQSYNNNSNNNNNNKWWQLTHLARQAPWIVDWRERINGVWVLYDDVPLSQLLYVLSGALVGLVGKIRPLDDQDNDDDIMVIEEKDMEQQKEKQTQSSRPVKGKTNKNRWALPNYFTEKTNAKPNPYDTTCFGLGVIHTIDSERQQFHILTPLPADRLGQVTHLVKGDLELPVYCMLDQEAIRAELV